MEAASAPDLTAFRKAVEKAVLADEAAEDDFPETSPPSSSTLSQPRARRWRVWDDDSGRAQTLPLGLSEHAQKLIAARLAVGTTKAYAGPWRHYEKWCETHHIPAVRASQDEMAIQVANWVAEEQREGDLGVSACKTRIAAVSTKVAIILGSRLGEHPILSALMGGLRKVKPEQPRYESHPDLRSLWALFDRLPDNEGLSHNLLVGKVTALLLLFGLRKSDQVRISLLRSDISPREIRFRTLTKETRATMWVSQPIPEAPATKKKRCAVRAIHALLSRKSKRADPDALFTAEGDGHPLATATLGEHVKAIMRLAGIDTDKFKPHVLRGMGASRALDGNIPAALVSLQFRWSPTSNVFPRHYLRAGALQKLAQAIYK